MKSAPEPGKRHHSSRRLSKNQVLDHFCQAKSQVLCLVCHDVTKSWVYSEWHKTMTFSWQRDPSLGNSLGRDSKSWFSSVKKKTQRMTLVCSLCSLVFDLIRLWIRPGTFYDFFSESGLIVYIDVVRDNSCNLQNWVLLKTVKILIEFLAE